MAAYAWELARDLLDQVQRHIDGAVAIGVHRNLIAAIVVRHEGLLLLLGRAAQVAVVVRLVVVAAPSTRSAQLDAAVDEQLDATRLVPGAVALGRRRAGVVGVAQVRLGIVVRHVLGHSHGEWRRPTWRLLTRTRTHARTQRQRASASRATVCACEWLAREKCT